MWLHSKMSVNGALTEHKQSNNNFGCSICYIPMFKQRLFYIIEVMATFTGNVFNVVVTT
jgi:hypothetical protein